MGEKKKLAVIMEWIGIFPIIQRGDEGNLVLER
jgi:hypothetical protein